METQHVSKAQEKRDEVQRCMNRLRVICPTGTRVYALCTVPSSYGRSGYARYVRLFVIEAADTVRGFPSQLVEITYDARIVMGYAHGDSGMRISGCGFEAEHEAVHSLAHKLHGDGRALTRERL